MPIRLTSTFETAQGTTHTIDIIDTDWVGATFDFKLGPGGLNINYEAEGTGQNRFEPIIPSNIDFSIIWDDASIGLFVNNYITAQEDRFYVNVYQGAAKSKVLWRGKLVQDLMRYEDTESVKIVKLTATDGLNSLRSFDISYLNSPDPVKVGNVIELLNQTLAKALPKDLWSNGQPYLRTCGRWFEDDMDGTTSIDPLRYTRLKYKTLFWRFNDDASIDYDDLHTALSKVAVGFGLRIFMADGRWNAIQVAQYRNANSLTYHQYDKRYTSVANDPDDDGLSGASIITTNATIDIDFEPTDYRKGNEWAYLPAVREVRSTLDFKGANLIAHTWVQDPVGYQTVGDVDVIGSQGLIFQIRVYGDYGGSTGVSGTYTHNYTLTVRLGSYYLKPDGSWTTTATTINLTMFGVDNQYNIRFDETFVFNTATIPTTDELEYQLTYTAWPGASGTGTATVHYSEVKAFYDIPETGLVRFTTSNTAYPNSSVIIDLGNVEFGDFQVLGTDRTLQIWNGTSWENSDDWQFEKTGTKYQFNYMLTLDLMRSQRAPTRKYEGSVIGDASYFHAILRNINAVDYRFMPMRATYNTIIGEWRGEWVECGYEVTSITTDEELGIEPAQKIASTNQILTATGISINDVYKVGNTGAGIDEGDTVTTIDIADLPNDLKKGNVISLVNPITKQKQSFTVSDDVAAGTSVSVSVTSATADADFPPTITQIVTDNATTVAQRNELKFWTERTAIGNITITTEYSHWNLNIADGCDEITLSTTSNEGVVVNFLVTNPDTVTLVNVDAGATTLSQYDYGYFAHYSDVGWVCHVVGTI